MKAIKLVTQTSDQKETEGYDVNLRNDYWLNLGLVEDNTIVPAAMALHAKLFPMTFEPKPKPKAKE